MRPIFSAFLVLHGLIHLLGVAKAFGLAELPQLTRPISPAMGLAWLLATILFVLTAVSLFAWPRWWWAVGAASIGVSTIAIVPSWEDASFGALANLVVLVGVVIGFLTQGPLSPRAEYEREVARLLAVPGRYGAIGEADVAHLPQPVQRYLRTTGAIGRPRVLNFRARMHGRIRNAPGSRWMPFTAEQHNFFGDRARLFYMDASMLLIPFQVLHRYVGDSATMQVRIAGLVRAADQAGPEMTQAETVTLFNDMCIMAPGTLIDPAIGWEEIDDRTVRAAFTNAGHTISAALWFDEAGQLIDFRSDDRRRAGAGDVSMTAVPWSTPVGAYRSFGPVRLASRGEGRWHEETGEYAYIELEVDEVRHDVR